MPRFLYKDRLILCGFKNIAGLPLMLVKKQLFYYAKALNIPLNYISFYAIVGLGRVGLNMEEFPEHSYIKMPERGISYISELLD